VLFRGKEYILHALRASPSKRHVAGWLRDRLDSVYKQHPGFDPKAQTAFSLDLGAPQEPPDSLRGEAWQFVQLPLSTLVAELEDVRRVRPQLRACGRSRCTCSAQAHLKSREFSRYRRQRATMTSKPLSWTVMNTSCMAWQGKVFGEAFSLDLVGLSDLPADTAVPGVAVFSRRAVPLAAWTRCAAIWLEVPAGVFLFVVSSRGACQRLQCLRNSNEARI